MIGSFFVKIRGGGARMIRNLVEFGDRILSVSASTLISEYPSRRVVVHSSGKQGRRFGMVVVFFFLN